MGGGKKLGRVYKIFGAPGNRWVSSFPRSMRVLVLLGIRHLISPEQILRTAQAGICFAIEVVRLTEVKAQWLVSCEVFYDLLIIIALCRYRKAHDDPRPATVCRGVPTTGPVDWICGTEVRMKHRLLIRETETVSCDSRFYCRRMIVHNLGLDDWIMLIALV